MMLVVHRSPIVFIGGGVGFMTFPTICVLARLQEIDFDVGNSLWFSLFAFGFAMPVGIYLLLLCLLHEPVAVVFDDCVYLHTSLFPLRSATVGFAQITGVSTNWDPKGETRSDIILSTDPSSYEILSRERIWGKRDPVAKRLYFDLSNATMSPQAFADALWGRVESWQRRVEATNAK